jgi:hypothetical protein
MVKKVDLLEPFQEKQQTLLEKLGDLGEKTNELVDRVNSIDDVGLSERLDALGLESAEKNASQDAAIGLLSDEITAKQDPGTTLEDYGIIDAYTILEIDNMIAEKADTADTLGGYGITDAYTKAEVNAIVTGGSAESTTLAGYGITDAYTKTEVDTRLIGKADDATTLAGYGITDAYTIAQVDTALTGKADDADLATKADINHSHTFEQITGRPTTYPPNLMSGTTVGGAIVGNGLGMSGSYLYLKALRGLKIDPADNAVTVDRTVTDTWYQAKAAPVLANIATFSNGWTHLAGRELKYCVTGDNMLWLNGLVSGAAATSSATGTVIATLPAGLTPQVQARCVVALTGDLQGMIDINTDRTITIAASFTGVSTFKGWASINIMVPLV